MCGYTCHEACYKKVHKKCEGKGRFKSIPEYQPNVSYCMVGNIHRVVSKKLIRERGKTTKKLSHKNFTLYTLHASVQSNFTPTKISHSTLILSTFTYRKRKPALNLECPSRTWCPPTLPRRSHPSWRSASITLRPMVWPHTPQPWAPSACYMYDMCVSCM